MSIITEAIDRSIEKPLYQQIADKLRHRIEEGKLQPSARLPSVRELMDLYATTNQTIQRAIRELKSMGLVRGKPGSGVYVTFGALSQGERSDELRIASAEPLDARTVNEFQRRAPGVRIASTQEKPDVFYVVNDCPSNDCAEVGDLIEELLGYNPHREEFLAALQHRGRNVVFPTFLKLGVMFCNVDAFEAQKLSLPERGWTWGECLALARELNRPSEGRYGIYLSGLLCLCMSVLWQRGGALFTPDGTRCRLDSEAGIAAGRLICELAQCGPPQEPVNQRSVAMAFDEFAAGRAAMFIAPGQIAAGFFKRVNAVRWKAVPLPSDGAPVYMRQVWGYGINRATSAPGLAREFLRVAGARMRLDYEAGHWHGVPLLAEYARRDEAESAYRWTAVHSRDPLSDVLPERRQTRHRDVLRLMVHEFIRINTSERSPEETMMRLNSQLNALLSDDQSEHF